MEMEKREHYIALYDIYKNLLTDKQRAYFEDYYYLDLSISEIAINYDISRNGVHDQIKRVVTTLLSYEEKLRLFEKFSRIEELELSQNSLDEILSILKE